MRLATRMAMGLVGALLLAAVACGDDRSTFQGPGKGFEGTADAAQCGFQCSLDGRSVVDACTGEVVETCSVELACGGARCQEPCAAAAADRSSNGCEFYFQMPRFSGALPQSCHASFIVNVSSQPVSLSLERDGQDLDLSRSLYRTPPGASSLVRVEGPIAPGEAVILFVSGRTKDAISTGEEYAYQPCPDGVVTATVADFPSGTRVESAFHLKASAPVSAVSIYPFGGAQSYHPSATLLFPVSAWGKEHVMINAWEAVSSGLPSAQIYASEDDTGVTVIPTRDIQNGASVQGSAAHVPMTYTIDKGQFLQIVQADELSGSIVTSDKPTAMVGGHGCAYIPSNKEACEILSQQIPPFEQWGNEYVGVGYRPRLGNEHEELVYRVVAARDGTKLDYDPAIPTGAPDTLSAGEVATFQAGTGDAFVVRAQDVEHPIYLAAYMTAGESFGGRGDPEFVNVVPAGQYLNAYSFYADPTFGEASLVVVRAKQNGAFEDVWLECAGNLTDFRPIGTRGKYEFVRVDLARGGGPGQALGDKVCQNGLQRMRSEGPFTATVWGWDLYASYAYPGGVAQRKLVATPLAPVR